MKWIRKIHSVLGIGLCLFFLMWFLSGYGMMFSSMPSLRGRHLAHKPTIDGALPPLDSLLAELPEGETLRSLQLTTLEGKPIFDVRTNRGSYQYLIGEEQGELTLLPKDLRPSGDYIKQYASSWCDKGYNKVDTLTKLDTWTPYPRMQNDLPIYRFHLNDPAKSYLYVSSRTGEALQFATKKERITSCFGTIPHMLYIRGLRKNHDTWVTTVTVLTALGAIMTLSGLILGIHIYRRTRRRTKKLHSPYRWRAHRWHHVYGTIFGFFIMMFSLSALMMLNDLPSWMVKVYDTELQSQLRSSDNFVYTGEDYRELLTLGEVQEIRFERYGDVTFYTVTHGGEQGTYRLDSDFSVQPLHLTEAEVLASIGRYIDAPMTIELLGGYDNYYSSTSGRSELPIYRVKAEDPDRSYVYVSPTTGYTRYYSTNSRVKKWIYPAFHSLRFKFFTDRPTLRRIVMLLLTTGGTIVSGTGVVLAYRRLRRSFSRSSRRRKLQSAGSE